VLLCLDTAYVTYLATIHSELLVSSGAIEVLLGGCLVYKLQQAPAVEGGDSTK
jgi:hypothetical protein